MRGLLTVLLLGVAFFCLTAQGTVSAQDDYATKRGGPQNPTVLELKSLPAFCTAKWKLDAGQPNAEEIREWRNTLGEAFDHLHHYCDGLNFVNRVRRGVGDKGTLLGLALGEFHYMQRIPSDNVLRPQLELNIGQALYMADRIPEATAALRKAILLKPGYEGAYLLLSFCYRRLGDSTRAARTLEEGTTRVPDSRALRDALEWMNSQKEKPDGGAQVIKR